MNNEDKKGQHELESPTKVKVSANSSFESDEEKPITSKQLQNIDDILKDKLRMHDIQEIEIDTGYHKSRFDSLYSIKGLLGVGAFGVVIEAINKQTQEIIALKIITQENSKGLFKIGPEMMEQQVLQELQHKNIIIFKRILYSNYHVFIEMEKVNGGTLESFIKKRRLKIMKSLKNKSEIKKTEKETLGVTSEDVHQGNSSTGDISPAFLTRPKVIPENVARIIARDICNGLHQIHKKNYIHRDLKPENILINENRNTDGSYPTNPEDFYHAKIADFGLSAEVHSNVFRGQDKINDVTGTILFMAPEQATGQRYGKRVDIWALGIIIFQMLTGKHPFYLPSDTTVTYIDRIVKQPLDKLLTQSFDKYDISQSAQSLIRRLLARGISDRYRVVQVLEHPWISGNDSELPPLTQNEVNMQMEGEIKLRNIQSIVLFLAISKNGKQLKKSYFQQELMNKYNNQHNRNHQFSGMTNIVSENSDSFSQLTQSISCNISSKNLGLASNKNENSKIESEKRRSSIQKVMGLKNKIKQNQEDTIDPLNDLLNLNQPLSADSTPKNIGEKGELIGSKGNRILGNQNYFMIEPSYLKKLRQYCSYDSNPESEGVPSNFGNECKVQLSQKPGSKPIQRTKTITKTGAPIVRQAKKGGGGGGNFTYADPTQLTGNGHKFSKANTMNMDKQNKEVYNHS